MFNNEDFLQLGDSTGLACMSPGMPATSFAGKSRTDMSMIDESTDLWGPGEDSDDDLPPYSKQSHLILNHQDEETCDGMHTLHSETSWKETSGTAWKASSYQDVLKAGGNHEV
jgi:hypothetical protein